MRARLALLAALIALPAAASARAPRLADGFSLVATAPAPLLGFATQESFNPAEFSTDASAEDVKLELTRQRYLRATRLHRTGIAFGVAGGVGAPVALVVLISGALGQNEGLAVTGAVMTLVTGGAAIGGTILANVGALNATARVEDATGEVLSNGAGIGGLVLLGAGLVSTPLTTWVGPAVAVGGGLILSAVQMSTTRPALRRAGLITLVPTSNGLMVAGRF